MLKVVGRILNIALLLGFIVLVMLLFVVPLATTLMYTLGYNPGKAVRWWLHQVQHAQAPAMHVFVIVWVSFVGSCFASFLNVVAWRVPRGKSILGSSHCPQCNIKLKFPQTNIPVLGWLRNGGRCANCDLPIPVRYLIAELVLGSTFLILFLVQTFSGGAAIPFRPAGVASQIVFDPQVDLLLMLGFHLMVLSVIFTLSIAATEKFAAPISIIAFAVFAAIGFQLVPFAPGIVDYRHATWENGIGSNQFLNLLKSPTPFALSVAIGIATAGLCFLTIKFSSKSEPYGVFASLLLAGICFGWQAVLSVTILFLLISIRVSRSGCALPANISAEPCFGPRNK